MQAAETVYEFGSSPDEDEESGGQPNKSRTNQSQNEPTNAGTNLRPNKASSTSINQKLNTSFCSISDNQSPSSSNKPNVSSHQHHGPNTSASNMQNISASEEQLMLKTQMNLSGDGSSNLVGGSIGNTSNTSLSSASVATNSSRGNTSQITNQSTGNLSQICGGHQQSSSSSQQQNPNFDSNVISERVKNLATQIYQELKRIISRCNYDEDILSGLMPLIVRVLESLDLALIENQQLLVELELCKDDNDQLVKMFEKEKAAKRAIDKKLIESEYAYEEERQQYQQKIETLDNTVKMFELKAKNASDQATRFEEKEAERKREYHKLHDRYTELLKSHCDVVERVRHLVGKDEAANLHSISVPQQMVATSSDLLISDLPSSKYKLKSDDHDYIEKGMPSIKAKDTLKSWNADTELTLEDASLVVIDDLVESQSKAPGDESSHNESERATSELEGEHEKESENDSIAYTSMEKEFRKLIQENKDLLNTKNALNVVKDDLIAEVDRLTNEVSMYEQAVEQLNSTKDQMKQKVSALDSELRKTKEELEKAKQKIRENNEEGVPYSQRKRFGRAEMAKVLMERNNYKERFMELQDAVRYTELVRANKVETEKRSGLWKFFSNLFGAPPPPRAIMNSPRNSSPVISYASSPATSATVAVASVDTQFAGNGNSHLASDALSANVTRANPIRSVNQRLTSNSDLIVLMDSDLNIDRSRASRDGSAGGRSNSMDASGYIHAYGWSLRASSIKNLSPDSSIGQSTKISTILGGTSSYGNDSFSGAAADDSFASSLSNNKLAGLQVPVPQYCRPLTGDSLGMKIWCAVAIDLSGGDLAKESANLESMSPKQFDTTHNTQVSGSSESTVNISSSTPVKASNQAALRRLEQEVNQALGDSFEGERPSRVRPIKTTTDEVLNSLPYTDDNEEISSCVWICSTQHSRSKITIIDIETKPNDLLDSFYVPTFLYCIRSIPGTKSSDLLGLPDSEISASQNDSTLVKGMITLKMIDDLISNQKAEFYRLIKVTANSERCSRLGRSDAVRRSSPKHDDKENDDDRGHRSENQNSTPERSVNTSSPLRDDDAEISRILDNNVSAGVATLQKLNDFVAHTHPQDESALRGEGEHTPTMNRSAEDEAGCNNAVYYQPISTHLPTVWMGGKDSVLYIHSAVGQWKDCIACVELKDSILQICHFKGRVFVALADGSLCIFFRNSETRKWELSQYLLIDISLLAEFLSDYELHGCDHNDPVEIHTLVVDSSLDTDGHTTQNARGLSDPTDYPTTSTQGEQPQEPRSDTSDKKHPPPKSRRSRVAGIHCLQISNKNLWIGYRNRVIVFDPITMKLKHTFCVVPQVDNQIRQLSSMKDGVFICLRSDLTLRLYSSLKPYQHIQNIDVEPVVTRLISPKTFVISHITAMRVVHNTLWIGIAHGIILTIPCKLVPQISEAPVRRGHSGELEESPSHLSIARFVPKCDINNAQISFHGHRDAVKFFVQAHNLMLSGGQGYLDFRIDMDDQSKSISDKSHLILWQLPPTK